MDEDVLVESPERASESEEPQESTVDEILLQIGEFGRYQIYLTFLVCIFMLITPCQNLSVIFTGLNPTWRCTAHGNLSSECNGTAEVSMGDYYDDNCKMSKDSWEFIQPPHFSYIIQVSLNL